MPAFVQRVNIRGDQLAGGNRREQILQTALQLFAKYGYKKTTVEDIAGALGLTKGALYLYVKNKQDLYEKTAAWALAEWQQRVREAVTEVAGPEQRLRVMALSAFEYLLGHEELLALINADTDFYADLIVKEPFAAIHRDSVMMMESVLADGVETGVFQAVDPAAVADALFSLYLGFIAQTRMRWPRELLLSRYRTMLDLMCAGLLAKSAKIEP